MVKLWAGVHVGDGVTWHVWHCAWHHDTARDTVRLTRDNNSVTEVAIAPALSAVSSSPESQKIVEQQREATTSHHINKVESQSQSKTVILCRDPSGRTCLWKQSMKEQRIWYDKSALTFWISAFSSSQVCVSYHQRFHHLCQLKIWISLSPSPPLFTDLTQKSCFLRSETRMRRRIHLSRSSHRPGRRGKLGSELKYLCPPKL